MDYGAERRFVGAFVREDRRERLLYELTTPKKRSAGLSRFCHRADEFLDAAKVRLKGGDLDRQPAFQRFVLQHDELCYVLSADFWLDEHLPLREAVVRAALCADAVLILGSTFAVVFTEVMKGGRDKYLLCEE